MDLVAKQRRLDGQQYSTGLMLCLSGFLVLGSTPCWASEVLLEVAAGETEAPIPGTETVDVTSIPQLSEQSMPTTTLEEWIDQIETSQVQTEVESSSAGILPSPPLIAQAVSAPTSLSLITGIQISPSPDGIQIGIETESGSPPRFLPPSPNYRTVLVVDLLDAQLSEGSLSESNPAPGILSVNVDRRTDDSVRLTIIGSEQLPPVNVQAADPGVVVSFGGSQVPVASVLTPVPTPVAVDPTPDPAPQPEEDPSGGEDLFTEELPAFLLDEVVVTATRTEEEITDVPRSVTVITREQIEAQSNLTTNLADILGVTVPGLGPPTQSVDTFPQTLRGREVQILIDGVPISTNQFSAFDSALRSIAPSAIERIEVVRGPSAAFGEGATGGVINIITRQPEEVFTQTIETRVNSRGNFADESFGTYVEYGLSGTEDPVDFTFNVSWETFGFAFDGAGDQIPGDSHSIENGNSLNLLGKLGVDIDENQRLQFSLNYFDEDSEAEFINDPNVADDPTADKARALEVDLDCLGVECGDARRDTTLSLNYSHDNLFGSQLRLQGFYRDTFDLLGVPFEDTRDPNTFLLGQQASERFGGRLEVETLFSETFKLLWGADYSNEEASQPYQVLDEEFVISGFRVVRLDEEVFFTPPYTVENLGLFAQAEWDVSSRWELSGGIRYESIGMSVDDYTATLFVEEPINVEGGSISADDVVFNFGTVYDLTDELNLFVSFAQGFSAPDFGRLLRRPPDGFRSVEEDLDFTAPQKVNNYELGFRGQWDNIQFSLAGFYNESDLGASLIRTAETVELARAPQRIYGVEATVDWQPSPTWQLGGLISWNEGEDDLDEDGNFDPLSSSEIQPFKITGYLENQTLPRWRNRLQALYVGGRDRAFDPDDGPDFAAVESYFVLDYITSIDLGPGSFQVGVHNLLDELYFPIESQIFAPFSPEFNIAAPGRTTSIGYRVTF